MRLTWDKKRFTNKCEKSTYAVYKWNCYLGGKEIFEDDGSIEHIISETAGETALILKYDWI